MATTSVQSDWSQGYVHDLAYADNFFAESAPAHLSYVAILNGFRPRPLNRPFASCELGCGNGQTSTVLAAANPTGRQALRLRAAGTGAKGLRGAGRTGPEEQESAWMN